ncbi:hypothetical protein [Streptomyces flavidovirens]|uniref:hypothetical protein n=1 Tax=Streptomyces flavidovirens TaxID=67298 RepID=UPI0003FE352F|nr:hypothetical protein [Streptomyces flavidovirens]
MKARNSIVRTLTTAAAAGALAWAALTGGSADAPAEGDGATSIEAIANEAPGYAIEDFNYPHADKIFAEQGIKLKRGDGHIVLADCASGTGLLEISARGKPKICFRVTGDSGWLTLEIPAVNGIKGNDYTTQVDMTVGDEEKTYDINKNSWTPVGETADPQGRDHVLVEIRTTK